MKFNFLIIICALVLLASCNKTTKDTTVLPVENKTENKTVKTEPSVKAIAKENYSEFYDRFHSDSIFQMKRIAFPIDGYHTDSLGSEQNWNQQNWIVHKLKIIDADTAQYKTEFKNETTFKIEKLYIEGSGFKVERKFKQIKGKWYLVYYSDDNF